MKRMFLYVLKVNKISFSMNVANLKIIKQYNPLTDFVK